MFFAAAPAPLSPGLGKHLEIAAPMRCIDVQRSLADVPCGRHESTFVGKTKVYPTLQPANNAVIHRMGRSCKINLPGESARRLEWR